jgi:DNA-binding MarR family transcriptional regulator
MHSQDRGNRNLTDEVVIALRRIIRAVELHSHALLTRYGLTGSQLAVLRVLADQDGAASVGVVARRVHLSQATVTGIVDRLQRHGYVARLRSDTDKRRVLVSLTSDAEKLLSKAPPPLQESFIEELDKLQEWEQTQVLAVLQRVVAMMEAPPVDATTILTTASLAGPSGDPPDRTDAPASPGSEIDAGMRPDHQTPPPSGGAS